MQTSFLTVDCFRLDGSPGSQKLALFAAVRQLLDQSDKTFLLALGKLREYDSHSHARMRRLHISRASELHTFGLHSHVYLGSCRQRRKSLHIAAAEGDISQGSPKASRAALRAHFNAAITDIANMRSFFSKRHSYSTSLGVFTPTYWWRYFCRNYVKKQA